MILAGLKAAYQASGSPVPAGLSRRVSAVVDARATRRAPVRSLAKAVRQARLRAGPRRGLSCWIARERPGRCLPGLGQGAKVAEQVAGNRYVGIQIALAMDDTEKLARMAEIFEGGPADRAGARTDDLIEKVDGVDTKGMETQRCGRPPARRRGNRCDSHGPAAEGESVAGSQDDPCRPPAHRRCTAFVNGVRGLGRAASTAPTRSAISGSPRSPPVRRTSSASWRRRLENEGCRAVVLDLRGLRLDGTAFHARSCSPIACSITARSAASARSTAR